VDQASLLEGCYIKFMEESMKSKIPNAADCNGGGCDGGECDGGECDGGDGDSCDGDGGDGDGGGDDDWNRELMEYMQYEKWASFCDSLFYTVTLT